eukprot:g849.t1
MILEVAVAVCSDSLERRSEHKEQKLMLELELEGRTSSPLTSSRVSPASETASDMSYFPDTSHENGTCKPCVFFFSNYGCGRGNRCEYCHRWHEEVRQVRRVRQVTGRVRSAPSGFQPYRDPIHPSGETRRAADGLGVEGVDKGMWNVLYLFLNHKQFEDNCIRFPKTEAFPRHYSHAFFSALTPGSHIVKHQGPSNRMLRVWLPLCGFDKFRLRVGEQILEPKEGQAFVWDHSYEHEAWHEGSETRLVLIVDIWHPDLSDAEVKFLRTLQSCFHAELHPVNGKFGASPFFALAGCDDFDDTTKRRCGHQETMVHVAMDAWISGYGHQWRQFQEEFPVIAPKDIGTMGYEGEETMYVSKEVLASAFGDAGLALDFYKSYNTTRDDPKKYFDHVQNISLDELLLCNESNFFVDSYMRNYIKFSGDVDGVLEQNGSFVAKCVHGRWWMAPTCRASFPECIPLFTAGNGWSLQNLGARWHSGGKCCKKWSGALVLVVLPDMCQLPKAGKTRVQQYFGLSIFDVDLMCPNKIDPPKQAVFTRSLCGLLHW